MYKERVFEGGVVSGGSGGGLEKSANAEKGDKAFWTLVESLAYLRFALGAPMGGGFEGLGEGFSFLYGT